MLLTLAVSACGGDDDGDSPEQARAGIDAADFSPTVAHLLVPLASITRTVFEGRERGDSGETVETRGVNRVLEKNDEVAGVPVTVVEVKEYEDGELVERTLDYYAQHRSGSVSYLGERVDDYEDGKVAGHEGQWLAGQGNAKPGLFMPADPKLGDEFEQERAPGVAEDRSKVVAVDLDVTTPAGKFGDCIKTKDFAPLDKRSEFKYYCPDVGLVREQASGSRFDLVSYR